MAIKENSQSLIIVLLVVAIIFSAVSVVLNLSMISSDSSDIDFVSAENSARVVQPSGGQINLNVQETPVDNVSGDSQ